MRAPAVAGEETDEQAGCANSRRVTAALASPRDLPGIKELRAAGLLDSTPPAGGTEDEPPGDAGDIDDMFADEAG